MIKMTRNKNSINKLRRQQGVHIHLFGINNNGNIISTLRNERFLGKGIPYIKIGISVRYKYEDVIEFMEAKRIETVYK